MENRKVGFLVNDFILKDDQATTYLLRKISSFVTDMYIFSVHDFISDDKVSALHLDVSIEDIFDIQFNLSGLDKEVVDLKKLDLILIRTNPGRDIQNHPKHARALGMLTEIENHGALIINSPKSLQKMHDKRYLFELPPSTVPRGREVKNTEELLQFLRECNNKVIIKPFVGTRGEGVRLVETEELVRSIDSFPILAQEFISTSDHADMRVCLFDGEVLQIEGVDGVVKRVPERGEFRSNVCLGATAHPTELTEQEIQTIERVRPWLTENKLRYVGLDLLGGKIIEINCFSPGGIQDYERFYKKPFGDYLIGSFIEEI